VLSRAGVNLEYSVRAAYLMSSQPPASGSSRWAGCRVQRFVRRLCRSSRNREVVCGRPSLPLDQMTRLVEPTARLRVTAPSTSIPAPRVSRRLLPAAAAACGSAAWNKKFSPNLAAQQPQEDGHSGVVHIGDAVLLGEPGAQAAQGAHHDADRRGTDQEHHGCGIVFGARHVREAHRHQDCGQEQHPLGLRRFPRDATEHDEAHGGDDQYDFEHGVPPGWLVLMAVRSALLQLLSNGPRSEGGPATRRGQRRRGARRRGQPGRWCG